MQHHPRPVSSLDRFLKGKSLNLAQVVGQTFQVVSGKDLLVHVKGQLKTPDLKLVEAFILHPERIVDVEVVVIGVQVNVLCEVSQSVVMVEVDTLVEDVFVNDVHILVSLLDAVEVTQFDVEETSLHFEQVGFLDDIRAQEVEWVDFVRWREDDTLAVLTVPDSDSKGVHEHTLVNVHAHPASGLEEGYEILGVVQHVEKGDHFFQLAVDVDRKDFTTWQQAYFEVVHEFFHDVGSL